MADGADVLDVLKVVITTDLSQFKLGMAEVRRTIDGLKPTVGALGLALTGLIATGFQNVVQSADALRDVNRILQGLGYDVGTVGDKVGQMAQELSDVTRYDDVEITDAFRTLLSVTQDVEQAMMLWGPALDLAAAQGIPVEQAAQAIARYVKDGGGQLIRWYPWLKDAATEAERMKAVTGDLVGVIGGAASRSASLANAWADLKNKVSDFTKVFVPENLKDDGLIKVINDMSDAVKWLGETIDTYVPASVKGFVALAAVIGTLLAGASGASALAGALGMGGLSGVLAGLAGILVPLGITIGIFGLAWTTNFGGIRDVTREFVPQILDALSGLWDNVKDLWASFKSGVLDPLMPYLSMLFGAIWTALMHTIKQVVLLLSDAVGFLADFTQGDWKAVWGHLVDFVVNILELLFPGAKEALSKTVEFLKVGLWEDLAGVWDTAKNWGRNLIQSFADGINSKVQAVKDAVSGVVGTVKRFLGFSSPAEEGPGKDADKWMPNLVGMWADQLASSKSQIAAAVADIAGSLNIAPQINTLAAAGGGGVSLTLNITGNTFRDREDIDYLVDRVVDKINRGVGRGVSKWRG